MEQPAAASQAIEHQLWRGKKGPCDFDVRGFILTYLLTGGVTSHKNMGINNVLNIGKTESLILVAEKQTKFLVKRAAY